MAIQSNATAEDDNKSPVNYHDFPTFSKNISPVVFLSVKYDPISLPGQSQLSIAVL